MKRLGAALVGVVVLVGMKFYNKASAHDDVQARLIELCEGDAQCQSAVRTHYDACFDSAYKLARSGTQFRFVASPRDPYVPFELNTQAMVDRLTEFGGDVSLRVVDGPHDDPSHYSAHDIVDFANSCAGTED